MTTPDTIRRFAGRRVLVTGSSRGIGARIARRLAAEGAHVALTARTLEPGKGPLSGSLEETRAALEHFGGRVAAVVADLADPASRARIVPEAAEALGGPIEILVNNAAAAVYGLLADYSSKRARLSYEINVLAPLELAQAVIPDMRAAGEGWIVNLSSATAKHPVGPPYAASGLGSTTSIYGASKAALNRVSAGLAMELYGTGIRVNTVEPRAAVMSEGASEVAGSVIRPDQIEPMETMVEAAVALCCCDTEHTGRTESSLALIKRLGLPVYSIDAGPFDYRLPDGV